MKNDVYIHLRATDGAPFYVGIGRPARAGECARRTLHWKNVFNKHGRIIKYVARNVSRDDAIEMEQFLIAWIGRDDRGNGPLVNMTDGGEGVVGRDVGKKLSPEHIAKLSAAKIGTKQSRETVEKRLSKTRGQKRSADAIEKFCQLARNRTPEHKEKLRAALTGKRFTQERLEKLRSSFIRPIICKNTGVEFKNARQATEWLRGIGFDKASQANITACALGRVKTAYGYFWEHA